jgi:hypothetical protein
MEKSHKSTSIPVNTWFPFHHERVRIEGVGIVVHENETVALVIVPREGKAK